MKKSMTKKLVSLTLCAALMAPGAVFAAEGDVSLEGYRAFIGNPSSNNIVSLDYLEAAIGTADMEKVLDNYLASSESETRAYERFGKAVNGVYLEAQAMGFDADQIKAVFIAQTNLETGVSKPDVNQPGDPNLPPPSHHPSDEELARYVNLVINGDRVYGDEAIDIPFVNDDSRTMIPLRLVSSYMGYNTDWTEDGSINIYSDDRSVDVKLKVGSLDFTNKGEDNSFDTVPILKENRTYLPARDFVELYGSIDWNNDSRTVTIYPEANYNTTYKVTETGLVRTKDGVDTHMLTSEGGEVVTSGAEICKQKVMDGVTYLLVQTKGDNTHKGVLLVDNGDTMSRVTEMNTTSSFVIKDDILYYTEGTDAGAWSVDINAKNLLMLDLESGASKTKEQSFNVNSAILLVEDDGLAAIDQNGEKHSVQL